MKVWESDFPAIKPCLCLLFCFVFYPLLTSKSYYSTSLIQFAVRRFASLNIAFAITFMSTRGFRRCIFFFSFFSRADFFTCCIVHCMVRFYSLFMLVLKQLEGQQPPPNTARRANIFFYLAWWERTLLRACCGNPLLWRTLGSSSLISWGVIYGTVALRWVFKNSWTRRQEDNVASQLS